MLLCNVASDGELHTAVVDGASLVSLTFFTNLSILSEPYKHVRKAAVITTSCSYNISVIMNINKLGYAGGGQMPPLAPSSGRLCLHRRTVPVL